MRPRVAAVPLAALLLAGCAGDRTVRVPSENYNSRVSVVVIHHTTANFEDALRILTKRSGNPVSSHYLIPEPDDPTYPDKKLRVYKLVDETERAWHAGESYWGGRSSINDQSIGIEIVNQTWCHRSSSALPSAADWPDAAASGPPTEAVPSPASICFYPDFAETQMALLIELLEDITKRHPSIRPTQIVGHSDIAPDRKIDPGPRFPWQRLYRLGYGAWFDDDTVIRYWERFRHEPPPLINIQKALSVYGYGIDPSGVIDDRTRNVVRAFQMHFRPDQSTGELTTDTVAVLYALIEKYFPDELEELLRVDHGSTDAATIGSAAR